MKPSDLGKLGEEMAVNYFTRRNFRILARNFRVGGGELDIVASFGGLMIFIEVKARSGAAFGSGAEALTMRKRQRMKVAISRYFQSHVSCGFENWRVDCVEILFRNDKPYKLLHSQDIEL